MALGFTICVSERSGRFECDRDRRQSRSGGLLRGQAVDLWRVSEHFQSDLETLGKRGIRGNLPRRCAITLCWDDAGLSHHGIAALFPRPRSNSVASDDSANEDL
jgi:hypothetical protein